MVTEISKYLKYFKNQFFFEKKLNFLILYITSNCNFKCRTCFFHQNINKESDLSFEEFDMISQKLDKFSILILGGGEPFLRPDIKEIALLFARRNKIDTLYIPTNGFLTEKILVTTKILLESLPDLTISINPSLDGLEFYHDELRGMPLAFENVIKTIEGLVDLKKKYKNLQVIVNSVIHKENIDELKELAVFLRQFNIDYHAFEVLRGEVRDKALIPADPKEIKNIHNFILENRRWYFKKQAGQKSFFNLINQLVTLGHLAYVQSLKELVLFGKKWPMKCVAGDSIVVVYPNGDVGLCELLKPIGNLRQHDYDLKEVLLSSLVKEQREMIHKKCSSCTHICFINASIARDWKTAFKLPYFYFKSK